MNSLALLAQVPAKLAGDHHLFQYVAIPVLALLLAWDLVGLFRRRTQRTALVLRCLVWLTAIAAIADPQLIQRLASLLGIGRGTDVVLYFFVIVFLLTTFYFYSQMVNLQRQITQLTRHLAIQEAQRGQEKELPPA